MTARAAARRVAIFLPSLAGGGTERVMVTLANEFSGRGIGTYMILARAVGPFLNELASAVSVVDLRTPRVAASIPKLSRVLQCIAPSALLTALGHCNVAAVVASRLAGTTTRVVVSERSHLSRAHPVDGGLRSRLLVMAMRWAYPQADGIVAVSGGVGDDMARRLRLPRSRIETIFNPVVTNDLDELSRVPVHHPWFAEGQPPIILAVGRLTAAKGFSDLICAFALLRQRMSARLVILGEGELRSDLCSLIRSLSLESCVTLPGFVPNPFSWMRRSSVFVLSSHWEGMPNALVQAMACGTKVVSTDCASGPFEILEGGRWGRLVPVANIEALAAAIESSLLQGDRPAVEVRASVFRVGPAVDNYLRMLLPQRGCAETSS